MLLLIDARRDHLSSIESHLSVSKIFGVVAEEETASVPVDIMMHGPVKKQEEYKQQGQEHVQQGQLLSCLIQVKVVMDYYKGISLVGTHSHHVLSVL